MAVAACISLSGCMIGAVGDCGWGGTVKAWIDTNANGQWDSSEQPLAGVIITSRSGSLSTLMTGKDGQAVVDNIWSPGCGPEGIVIDAQPPAGFRSTTPSSVSVQTQQSVAFGFTYDPNVPTTTPNPLALSCTSYTSQAELGDLFVNDLTETSAGDILAATTGGAARFDHAAQKWSLFGPSLYIAESIAEAPDGTVWVGTHDGLFANTPSRERALVKQNQLAGKIVFGLAISPDNEVWTAGEDGIAHFKPSGSSWDTFIDPAWSLAPQRSGIGTNDLEGMALAPDGSVWAANFSGILSHLTFDKGSLGSPHWQDYFAPSFSQQSPLLPGEPNGVVIAPDHGVWLVGFDGLTRIDAATGTIQQYPLRPPWKPTLGDSTTALAFARGGSLWIGTYEFGVVHAVPDAIGGLSQVMVYTAADGLADNHVTSLLLDTDDSLWVGTFRGVSHCAATFTP